jgi:ATP-independent RNA helicase DbpA
VGNQATLVFCNHREAVERISALLSEQDLAHDVYHGGLEQDARERALIKFRNGSIRLLITTDLASRGLDIPQIKSVIHYQLPTSESAFVHRNGRTARMHAEGTAFLIVSENEPLPAYVNEHLEGEDISLPPLLPEPPQWTTLYLAAGKKDKISKTDIVGLLLQKGNLQKDELGLIEVKDYASFVAVKHTKATKLIKLLSREKIKNKKVKIEIAR